MQAWCASAAHDVCVCVRAVGAFARLRVYMSDDCTCFSTLLRVLGNWACFFLIRVTGAHSPYAHCVHLVRRIQSAQPVRSCCMYVTGVTVLDTDYGTPYYDPIKDYSYNQSTSQLWASTLDAPLHHGQTRPRRLGSQTPKLSAASLLGGSSVTKVGWLGGVLSSGTFWPSTVNPSIFVGELNQGLGS